MTRDTALSTVQVAALLVVALVAGGLGAVALTNVTSTGQPDVDATDQPGVDATDQPGADAVSTFDSAEEFRSYLRTADRSARPYQVSGARNVAVDVEATDGDGGDDVEVDTAAAADRATETAAPRRTAVEKTDSGAPDGERRASDTNVQVEGIDEPDILKTTPRTVYYSPPTPHRPAVHETEDGRRPDAENGVRLINASDPAAP